MCREIRSVARLLARRPYFAVVAVALCAFSIAASTIIFAFADAIFWKPLPYKDPSRLVALYEHIPVGDRYHISYPDYLDWKQNNRTLTALDLYRPEPLVLRSIDGSQRVAGARVSDGFFRTVGITPFLGRGFLAGEDQPNAQRSVILSYQAWRNRFAANQGVLGSSITLDGEPYVIVGVLPEAFHFAPVASAEFWIPLDGLCSDSRTCHPYYGVGRLKDGATALTVYSDLSVIARRIASRYPQSNRDRSATVLPLTDAIFGDIRPTVLALLSGAGLLTLIGFLNVSSLMLVRFQSRRREMALRATLGATRGHLMREVAIEGMSLALAGCGIGLVFTVLLLHSVRQRIPRIAMANMPYMQTVHCSPHLVIFASSLAVLGAAVFSAIPILQLLSSDMQGTLMEGGRTIVGQGWRRAGATLVIAEWAITMSLLTSAGLLATSLYRLLHEDIGIAVDHLALLHVEKLDADSDAVDIALERQILANVNALPGVSSAAIAQQLTVASGESFGSLFKHFRVFGKFYSGQGDEANTRIVSTGYFETLRARLHQGRFFEDTDDSSHARVAIINRTMAMQSFSGEDPIGRRLIDEYDQDHPVEIIGVVDDMKEGPLDAKPTAVVYEPFEQNPVSDFYVTVRSRQSEVSILHAMVQAVHLIDARLVVDGQDSMSERIETSQSAYLHRSAAIAVGAFAASALVLGMVGLYGVISFSVAARTREIGMRMALGASRPSIYCLILSEAGWMAGAGIAGGVALSCATAGLIRSVLYGVQPWDLRILLSVAALLAGSSVISSFLPARRAASVNPVEALRAE